MFLVMYQLLCVLSNLTKKSFLSSINYTDKRWVVYGYYMQPQKSIYKFLTVKMHMIHHKQKSNFRLVILIILIFALTFSIFNAIYVNNTIDSLGEPVKEFKQISTNSGRVTLHVPLIPDLESANVRLTVK